MTEPSDADDDDTELPKVGDDSADTPEEGCDTSDASEVDDEDVEAKIRRVHFALDLSGMVKVPDFNFPQTDAFAQIMRAAGISDLTGKVIAALDLGPKLDLSVFDNLMPKIDVLSTLPRDIFPASAMSEHVARLSESMSHVVPKIDFQDLLPSVAFPALNFAEQYAGLYSSISGMFEPMMQRLRESLPPNWPESGGMFDLGLEIIRDEGVPLVWVPRKEIIAELLEAPDRDSRLGILLARKVEVTEDCRGVLEDVTSFGAQATLLRRAVDALEAGHDEAAQALAVVVTETAVTRSIGGYKKVKKKVVVDLADLPLFALRVHAALLPLGSFYTDWWPNKGTPPPVLLSRHATVHQADSIHYTASNALLAVILGTSVLRALQEFEESAEELEESA